MGVSGLVVDGSMEFDRVGFGGYLDVEEGTDSSEISCVNRRDG